MRGSHPFKRSDTVETEHIEFHGIPKREKYADDL